MIAVSGTIDGEERTVPLKGKALVATLLAHFDDSDKLKFDFSEATEEEKKISEEIAIGTRVYMAAVCRRKVFIDGEHIEVAFDDADQSSDLYQQQRSGRDVL